MGGLQVIWDECPLFVQWVWGKRVIWGRGRGTSQSVGLPRILWKVPPPTVGVDGFIILGKFRLSLKEEEGGSLGLLLLMGGSSLKQLPPMLCLL